MLCMLILLMTACTHPDASLRHLDELLDSHPNVVAHYQAQLDSMRMSFQSEDMTDGVRFESCGQLFDMYRGFDLDSQYVYAQKRREIASRLGYRQYIQLAQMNRAEVLMRSGMYHEALLALDSVSASSMESGYKPYYFHLRRTLYGLMDDFAITDQEKNRYHQLTHDYRDSIIRVEAEGSFIRELVRADALYADSMYDAALTLLETCESSIVIEDHNAGLMAITKAQIYRALGNQEEEKRYLIIAACADLQGAIREYIALRELALLLYHEGDIEHAYRYMTCAIEDANAGDMRSRSLEISTIYPIIAKAYQRQETIRTRMLYGLIVSITLLAGMLSLFLIYIARKREQLRHSNRIRTVYIGHYMEMTSTLIERFDNWRKTLNAQAKAGDIKKLTAELASQHFTQEQLTVFYRDFDEALLAIFPDFIEEVRALLADGTEFSIKPGERLNTDLRVLGCIRLGINDSKQISSFLRYSLSTIYNSRTRMRNLAKGNRDEFEKKVATF